MNKKRELLVKAKTPKGEVDDYLSLLLDSIEERRKQLNPSVYRPKKEKRLEK